MTSPPDAMPGRWETTDLDPPMLHRGYTNSQNRKVDIWDSILLHLISVDHPSDWYDIISQKEAFIAHVCISLHEAIEQYHTINTLPLQ